MQIEEAILWLVLSLRRPPEAVRNILVAGLIGLALWYWNSRPSEGATEAVDHL